MVCLCSQLSLLKQVCFNPPLSAVQDLMGQVYVTVAIPETPMGQK